MVYSIAWITLSLDVNVKTRVQNHLSIYVLCVNYQLLGEITLFLQKQLDG